MLVVGEEKHDGSFFTIANDSQSYDTWPFVRASAKRESTLVRSLRWHSGSTGRKSIHRRSCTLDLSL